MARIIDELNAENSGLLWQLAEAREQVASNTLDQNWTAELAMERDLLDQRVRELTDRNQALVIQLNQLKDFGATPQTSPVELHGGLLSAVNGDTLFCCA